MQTAPRSVIAVRTYSAPRFTEVLQTGRPVIAGVIIQRAYAGVTDPHAAHLVGHQNILGIDKVDFVPVPKDDPASHDIPRTADVHSINSDGVKYDPTNVVPDGFYEKHTLFGHTYVDKSHVYSPDDWASTRAALQQLVHHCR